MRRNGNVAIIIIVHVDYILVVGEDAQALRALAHSIGTYVDIRVDDAVKNFLGIKIEQNALKRTVPINDEVMIHTALERFGMNHCKPENVPIKEGTLLKIRTEEDVRKPSSRPYQDLVGVLLYLSNTVRPHISLAVILLSRFMHKSDHSHWEAEKRVLRYFSFTSGMGV